MDNTVEVVTLQVIAGALNALTVETRGKLFAIGNKIFAYGKAKGLEKNVDLVESIITDGTLQGLRIDKAMVSKAMKASTDGKLANKHNCYAEWSTALTDKDATDILDKAQGKERKPSTQKSNLQKALAAVDKLTVEEYGAIVAHIRSLTLKHNATVSAPAQKIA